MKECDNQNTQVNLGGWLMKLRIMTKLLAGYLSVIIIFVIMGVFAVTSLTDVSASYQTLTQEVNPVTVQARNLQALVSDAARAVTGYIATGDAAFRAEYTEADLQVVEILSDFREQVPTEEGKAIVDRIREAKETYDTVSAPVMLRRSFSPDEVSRLLKHDLRGPQLELLGAVNDLIALQERQSEQVAQAADRQGSFAVQAVRIGAALAALLGVAIAILTARGISRPVTAVAAAAQRLAEGDLTGEELRVRTRDEVAVMAAAFNHMSRTLRELLQQVARSTEAVLTASTELSSASEATAQAAEGTSSAIAEVAAATNEQSRSTAEVNRTIDQVQAAIQQIARGAGNSAADIQDAATLLHEMVSELDEMADTSTATAAEVGETAQRARAGADVVVRTLREIDQIGDAVAASADRIKSLEQLSGQIGAITEVISDIAGQTNLLALNAAIEAARAGEQGRGFAVVAEEVRKLAERSAASTSEIAELIHGIQTGTAEAVQAMAAGTERVAAGNLLASDARRALDEILAVTQQAGVRMEAIAQAAGNLKADAAHVVTSFTQVAALSQENTAATEEMAASAADVTRSVDRIARLSQENAAAAQEVSATVEELTASAAAVSTAAEGLAKTAGELQEQVGRFRV